MLSLWILHNMHAPQAAFWKTPSSASLCTCAFKIHGCVFLSFNRVHCYPHRHSSHESERITLSQKESGRILMTTSNSTEPPLFHHHIPLEITTCGPIGKKKKKKSLKTNLVDLFITHQWYRYKLGMIEAAIFQWATKAVSTSLHMYSFFLSILISH